MAGYVDNILELRSLGMESLHAIAYTSNGMPKKIIEKGELDIVLGKIMHAPCHVVIKEPEANANNNGGTGTPKNIKDTRCLVIKEPEANNESIQVKEAYLAAVVARYTQKWLERSKHNLGYQLNMDFNYRALDELQQFSVNNFGDPFIEGIYGIHSRDFEVGVLDWFAELWGIGKDEYWGYITNGGTEGNLHGLLIGREMLPDGILYTSEESHYSIFKVAHMYRMSCIKIKTLTSGEINCEDLKMKLLQNKDKPAIININIGTTIKGAIDDLDLVLQTLEKCGFSQNRLYIHCDGALSGIILPFLSRGPQITFKKPIGSMSVSGHKFLGCPMPCGVEIVRKKHIDAISRHVEYVASRDATITGSRNGHAPIFLWYNLCLKGHHGLKKQVQKAVGLAKYLENRLREARISAMRNELSNIVVFERPRDAEFLRRWQLAPQGNISHVCVMPHVTKEMLDTFVDELVEKRLNWFKDGRNKPPCVSSEIGVENCACYQHIIK